VISVRPYGRHFAVYEDDTLLAVCCYRKGAAAVKERRGDLLSRIAEPQAQLEGAASRAAEPEATPWNA
jgi:hypothetical protein